MIIVYLLTKITTIIVGAISLFDIEPIAQTTITYTKNLIDGMVVASSGFLNLIFPTVLVKVLIGIVISVEIGQKVYQLIMWILRKIPFTGIT